MFPLQASIPVYANKWFYVMGDFSRKTGLQVYSDGELVDGDVLGTNGNHVKSDNPQNFFVGSSVNQGAHARFQLASISTFKGALSPKTISHIYSYFWRQGKFMLWLTLASPSYFAVRKLLTFSPNFFPLKIVADVTSSYLLFPAVNCRVHHSFQMFPAKNPWLVKFQNAVLSWKNNNNSIKASKEHLLKRLAIFL